jgi:hypothetical protein
VPSKLVLQLDVDQFWIQLCSGCGPPDENDSPDDPSEAGDEGGIV